MPIRFHCESCEARVKVPAGSEGRRVKCPRCGHLQRVPRHSEQLLTVGAGSGDPSGDSAMGQDSGSFQAVQSETPAAEKAAQKKRIELGDSLSDLAKDFEKDMTPPQMQQDETPADEGEQQAEQTAREPQQMSLLEQQPAEELPVQDQPEPEQQMPQVESRDIAAPPEGEVEAKDNTPEPSEPPVTEQVVEQTPESEPAAKPAPTPAPPQPIILSGSASQQVVTKVSEPAPEPAVVTAAATTAAVASTEEMTEQPRAARPSRHVKPYTALKNLASVLRIMPAVLIPVVLWHVLQTVTVSGAIVTLISGAAIVAMTWTLAEIADAVRDLARRA